MAPGGPSPPCAGEYRCARQTARADTLSAARARNRIRCESLRSRTAVSSITARRRFLPTRTMSRRAAGT
jgi:hypothetical protein